MAIVIQKTAAEFVADNDLLMLNQIGQETDTGLTKVGYGNWNSLDYYTPVAGAFEQILSGLTYKVPSSKAVMDAIAGTPIPTLAQVLTSGSDGEYIEITNLGQIDNTDGDYSTMMWNQTPGYWQIYSENNSGTYQKSVYTEQDAGSPFSSPYFFVGVTELTASYLTDKYTTLEISSTQFLIGDNTYMVSPTFKGAQYLRDYSANYTSRSLVDKGYVASAIAAAGAAYELLANKATDFSTVNNTLYPTVQAVQNAITTAVTGLLDYRGVYDASGNLFPSSGGSGSAGAILKGDFWIISVAGVLGGVAVENGDLVISMIDTPGQTASNWDLIQYNIVAAALTKVDDTNVTLSLGGSPNFALLAGVSLTLGWTGQLDPSRGGTGRDFSALKGLVNINAGYNWGVVTPNTSSERKFLSQYGTIGVETGPQWVEPNIDDLSDGDTIVTTDNTYFYNFDYAFVNGELKIYSAFEDVMDIVQLTCYDELSILAKINSII